MSTFAALGPWKRKASWKVDDSPGRFFAVKTYDQVTLLGVLEGQRLAEPLSALKSLKRWSTEREECQGLLQPVTGLGCGDAGCDEVCRGKLSSPSRQEVAREPASPFAFASPYAAFAVGVFDGNCTNVARLDRSRQSSPSPRSLAGNMSLPQSPSAASLTTSSGQQLGSCPIPNTTESTPERDYEADADMYYSSSPCMYSDIDPRARHLMSLANNSRSYKTGRFRVTAFELHVSTSQKELCPRPDSRIGSKESSASDPGATAAALPSKSEYKMYRKGRFFVQSVRSHHATPGSCGSPATEELEETDPVSCAPDGAYQPFEASQNSAQQTDLARTICEGLLKSAPDCCANASGSLLFQQVGECNSELPSACCTPAPARMALQQLREYNSGRFNIKEEVLVNHDDAQQSMPAPAAAGEVNASRGAVDGVVTQTSKESTRKVGRFTIRQDGPPLPNACKSTLTTCSSSLCLAPPSPTQPSAPSGACCIRVSSAPSLPAVESGEVAVQVTVKNKGRFRVIESCVPSRPEQQSREGGEVVGQVTSHCVSGSALAQCVGLTSSSPCASCDEHHTSHAFTTLPASGGSPKCPPMAMPGSDSASGLPCEMTDVVASKACCSYPVPCCEWLSAGGGDPADLLEQVWQRLHKPGCEGEGDSCAFETVCGCGYAVVEME